MNSSYVYSRTKVSWHLSFVYAGKLLHYLTRSALMSVASLAMGLAWLCCWLDRFGSSKSSDGWMLPVAPPMPSATSLEAAGLSMAGMETATNVMSIDFDDDRTIDSLIRGKVGSRVS